jgi:ABC-type lipoprotein release transport system permease subunit
MTTEIVVAVIGLLGSGLGAFGGVVISAKLTTYRIEQLEKKVDKHNTVIERTFILEEKIKVANNRISDLEDKEK